MSQVAEASRRRWTQIISRQRASGLGVAQFCRREGLAPSTFFAWRRRLGEAGGDDGGGVALHSDSGGAAFVEVVAAEQNAEAGSLGIASASGVEICLCNGRRIAVARCFDQETLGRVLAVLEQMPALPWAGQGVRA